MQIAAGAFNRASDNTPNFDFTCTFRYDASAAPGNLRPSRRLAARSLRQRRTLSYDVNFNEAVDPTQSRRAI